MSNRAKQKGSNFEKEVAEYLATELQSDFIERRTLGGTSDRGDIGGVRFHGERVAVECKACTRYEIPKWLREAEQERQNDGAGFGVVVAKRVGVGAKNTGEQLVMMKLSTFADILKKGQQK